jgi:hypothetical protein
VRIPTFAASIRDRGGDTEGDVTSMRRDFRAITTRVALAARPGAALILGGLLLLTVP